jgi:hypothetical protein
VTPCATDATHNTKGTSKVIIENLKLINLEQQDISPSKSEPVLSPLTGQPRRWLASRNSRGNTKIKTISDQTGVDGYRLKNKHLIFEGGDTYISWGGLSQLFVDIGLDFEEFVRDCSDRYQSMLREQNYHSGRYAAEWADRRAQIKLAEELISERYNHVPYVGLNSKFELKQDV